MKIVFIFLIHVQFLGSGLVECSAYLVCLLVLCRFCPFCSVFISESVWLGVKCDAWVHALFSYVCRALFRLHIIFMNLKMGCLCLFRSLVRILPQYLPQNMLGWGKTGERPSVV